MSRSYYAGPKLPKNLLEQVQGGRISKPRRDQPPRRDQKRSRPVESYAERAANVKRPNERSNGSNGVARPRLSGSPVSLPKPAEHDEGAEESDGAGESEGFEGESADEEEREEEDEGEDSEDEEDEQSEESEPEAPTRSISKTARARLDEDDAEIARLERKLGIRSKSSKKSTGDDFDFLLDGDSGSDDDTSNKRKLPDDEQWLKSKRLKAQGSKGKAHTDARGNGAEREEHESDSFGGFESSEEDYNNELEEDNESVEDADRVTEPRAPRENPYVPPVTSSTAKYVPPSLRKAATSDEETLHQLRRQLQGLLNKLSEANMLSILQGFEEVYVKYPRQFVTETLVELLSGLVSDAATLNDTFLILHAGFATAVYRVIGADFGAQMLERTVTSFDHFQNHPGQGKQTLNLLSFLAYLYSLQMIGCEVVFDYIKLLLENFSEANTELLLRVIRTSGQSLRQDDPRSLKDIVLLLQRAVTKIGEDQLSVRTKFMVEVIQDLKNNRVRAGVAASALTAEHLQRMKKTLGSLSQNRHSLKSLEPLRITLADIRNTEKKGKWWLVGASWKNPQKMTTETTAEKETDPEQAQGPAGDGYESDASNSPDLDRLARAQGMNTDVRRAIFIAVAGAVDVKHAQERILKLSLKSKQQLEIPRVLIHCAGAEAAYNHFYTMVATRFCGDHRSRKAYEFALMDLFKQFGEKQSDDDSDDENSVAEVSSKKIFNLAKMYSYLVAEGLLRMTILKSLDLTNLRSKTAVFLEFLVTNTLLFLRKKDKEEFETLVKETFVYVSDSSMAIGLGAFIAKNMRDAELTFTPKERKTVKAGANVAVATLAEAARNGSSIVDEDDY